MAGLKRVMCTLRNVTVFLAIEGVNVITFLRLNINSKHNDLTAGTTGT